MLVRYPYSVPGPAYDRARNVVDFILCGCFNIEQRLPLATHPEMSHKGVPLVHHFFEDSLTSELTVCLVKW